MGITETLKLDLLNPLKETWDSLVRTIPSFIAALVVIIVGWLFAMLISWVVKKVLVQIKLDQWVIEKTKLSKHLGKFKLTSFLSTIVKWYVFILFLPAAASLVKLEPLAVFLTKLAEWVPGLIIALLIGLIGFLAAEYLGDKIEETKARGAAFLATIAKIVIIIFVVILALRQVKIDVSIAENTFLIILAGIMLAISIGFGLGLKDEAKGIIKDMKKKL